jgi:hypothetical protein
MSMGSLPGGRGARSPSAGHCRNAMVVKRDYTGARR